MICLKVLFTFNALIKDSLNYQISYNGLLDENVRNIIIP